jgi:hypothetical protein
MRKNMTDIPKTRNDFVIKLYGAMDAVWGYPIPLFKNWTYKNGNEVWKFFVGTTIPTGYAIEIEDIRNGWLKMRAGAEDNYHWDYQVGIECWTNIAVDFTEPLSFLKKYIEQMKMESFHKLTPELLGT